MSDGNEDILENWEEIDEAGLKKTIEKIQAERRKTEEESCANLPNTGSSTLEQSEIRPIEKRSFKLLSRTDMGATNVNAINAQEPSPLDTIASAFQPVLKVLHKDDNEYDSANYAQPTAIQTVKILRRPTQSNDSRENGLKPRQPIKSLKQREQEYAEARLRILGSAKNPEDDATAFKPFCNTSPTAPSTTTTSNASPSVSVPTTAAMPVSSTTTQTATSFMASGASKSNSYEPRMYAPPPSQVSYNHHQYTQPQQYQPAAQGYAYPKKPQQHLYQSQQMPQHRPHMISQTPAYNTNSNSRPPLIKTTPILTHPGHHGLTPLHGLLGSPFHQQQIPQQWSPIVGGNVSFNSLRQQQQQQQQQQQHIYPENTQVLRTPRGPDGSTGFRFRR